MNLPLWPFSLPIGHHGQESSLPGRAREIRVPPSPHSAASCTGPEVSGVAPCSCPSSDFRKLALGHSLASSLLLCSPRAKNALCGSEAARDVPQSMNISLNSDFSFHAAFPRNTAPLGTRLPRATVAKLSSRGRDRVACKADNVCYPALCGKGLLTPARDPELLRSGLCCLHPRPAARGGPVLGRR